MKIDLGKNELIHFVGIGGIGMSGLALIMNGLGYKVQGSDIADNRNIERLNEKKIKVFLNHKKENIKKITVLVISSAIKKNNAELVEAIKKNLPVYTRGDMLGHIVSFMRNVVVTGSHGKTTTTSLVSSIFTAGKLDPTIINGGILNSFGNSAKLGKSNWCVTESDESDGSFLKIPFTYSIATNLDSEHLDFYKNMNNLKKSFLKFIEKIPSIGKGFICNDDQNLKAVLKNVQNKNFYTYGKNKNSNFQIINIKQTTNFSKFDIKINIPSKKKIIKGIKLPMIGIHNIQNATAAASLAFTIGLPEKYIKLGLYKFKGVQRRFSHLFNHNKISFYDDYAHHPTEISSVLTGVKNVYKNKEIVCVFQPHRISRVINLKKEFSKCFKLADTILLCPIFTANEKLKLNFTYHSFAKLIIKNSNVRLIQVDDELQLQRFIKQNAFGEKIYIGMGAGSISNWMKNLKNIF
ncbi:UDP-N-acetylmuramate--L-alanine ligase [Pelagibacterales bacterium SAG-MED17]|nr:UDP-N-acetylmuramate--L-alanine ligase [Pelagibacterales bacterium SAG-MED17]